MSNAPSVVGGYIWIYAVSMGRSALALNSTEGNSDLRCRSMDISQTVLSKCVPDLRSQPAHVGQCSMLRRRNCLFFLPRVFADHHRQERLTERI